MISNSLTPTLSYKEPPVFPQFQTEWTQKILSGACAPEIFWPKRKGASSQPSAVVAQRVPPQPATPSSATSPSSFESRVSREPCNTTCRSCTQTDFLVPFTQKGKHLKKNPLFYFCTFFCIFVCLTYTLFYVSGHHCTIFAPRSTAFVHHYWCITAPIFIHHCKSPTYYVFVCLFVFVLNSYFFLQIYTIYYTCYLLFAIALVYNTQFVT